MATERTTSLILLRMLTFVITCHLVTDFTNQSRVKLASKRLLGMEDRCPSHSQNGYLHGKVVLLTMMIDLITAAPSTQW